MTEMTNGFSRPNIHTELTLRNQEKRQMKDGHFSDAQRRMPKRSAGIARIGGKMVAGTFKEVNPRKKP